MYGTEVQLRVRLLVCCQHESVVQFSEEYSKEKANLFSPNSGIPQLWLVKQTDPLHLVGLSFSTSIPSDHMQLLMTSVKLIFEN